MKIIDISSPIWTNSEQTAIDCVVVFEGMGPTPFTATASDAYAHTREIFARAAAGEFGPVAAYEPPPGPTHAQMAAAVLAKARSMRLPIMQVLDGMQASALVNATTVLVNAVPTPLAAVIETCKQALKDLPQAVNLSACTTRQQMELVVLQAYQAIVLAAPPEIKSAFDSLKP
jgi:hypothetical protein